MRLFSFFKIFFVNIVFFYLLRARQLYQARKSATGSTTRTSLGNGGDFVVWCFVSGMELLTVATWMYFEQKIKVAMVQSGVGYHPLLMQIRSSRRQGEGRGLQSDVKVFKAQQAQTKLNRAKRPLQAKQSTQNWPKKTDGWTKSLLKLSSGILWTMERKSRSRTLLALSTRSSSCRRP